MTNSKETIYIDVDDEITGIIDKVRDSASSLIVAVLPKRATVLQSSVNMKLLKRSADEASKKLVLITNEASLLPLAALSGIYVASDLNSKPDIPQMKDLKKSTNLSQENLDNNVINLEQSNPDQVEQPIGQLAKLAASIPLEDDIIPDQVVNLDKTKDSTVSKKPKKDKSLKVPNFNRFRVIFFLVVILLLIIGSGLYYALAIMPKAVIDIKTNASNIPINTPITLSTTSSSVDLVSNTIPAKQMSYSKTYTATVPTTGQQNNGQIASGNISISLSCSNSSSLNPPVNIPSGTGISYNNLTYITQASISLDTATNNKKCTNSPVSVLVDAVSPGSSYNLVSGAVMQVAPFTYDSVSYTSSDFSVSSLGISGGTDSIVQVVAQADINSATAQLNVNNNSASNILEQQFTQANLDPLPVTLTSSQPTVTDSAPVGATATSETVTEVITYNMYGVSKKDLVNILNSAISSQVSNSKQTILNNGFSNLSFNLGTSSTDLTLSTTAEVGPKINIKNLKKIIAGKKSGTVIADIKSNPNVTGVIMKLSPFWVTTVPTNPSDVIINIAKP